jgi:hypothetical protein
MVASGRSNNGRFASGNPGGPGRPRREFEREYLTAISDAVPLADWRAVIARAVSDAKGGDAKARDWLARYLIGDSLRQLAEADESANVRKIVPIVVKTREEVEQLNALGSIWLDEVVAGRKYLAESRGRVSKPTETDSELE